MRIKKALEALWLIIGVFIFIQRTVSAQQQDVPEPVFMNFSIQPLYVPTYHGRDPLKPLDNVERSQNISISELDYHGVMDLGGIPMALFTWRGNSMIQYTLKYRKLYSGGEKEVDGVVGDISDSKVVLIQGEQKISYPRK
jgi:hypothetical protein